ncbi:MAG: SUMF1/EgtB/PvdO family nonheme iron enzyme [bacterium]
MSAAVAPPTRTAREFDGRLCNTEDDDGDERSVATGGSFPKCRSAVGAYDMSGNVAEWTDDQTVRGGDFRLLRRGRLLSGGGCRSEGSARASIGFRCCSDFTEPWNPSTEGARAGCAGPGADREPGGPLGPLGRAVRALPWRGRARGWPRGLRAVAPAVRPHRAAEAGRLGGDLARAIDEGVPGTAMPAFKALPAAERAALVAEVLALRGGAPAPDHDEPGRAAPRRAPCSGRPGLRRLP